jgi:hypothetical protein
LHAGIKGRNACEVKGFGFLVGTGDPERAVGVMSITQISCTNFVKDPILRSATIIQTNSHNWEYDFLILRCFSFRVGGSGEATDSIILFFFFVAYPDDECDVCASGSSGLLIGKKEDVGS